MAKEEETTRRDRTKKRVVGTTSLKVESHRAPINYSSFSKSRDSKISNSLNSRT